MSEVAEMFEHLTDPTPPEPDAGARALVGRRAQQIHRRTQIGRAAMAIAVVLVLAGGFATMAHRGGTNAVTVANDPGQQVCCGSITGTVSSPDGPKFAVKVQLLLVPSDSGTTAGANSSDLAVNNWIVHPPGTATDRMGHYRFDNLEAGDYLIRFSADPLTASARADDPGVQPAFFGGAVVASKATRVHVAVNETSTNDVMLKKSTLSPIRGHVRTEVGAGLPLKKITVRLYVDGELTRETVTDDNGDYNLGGVPSGTYTLAFLLGPGGKAKWFQSPNSSSNSPVPLAVQNDLPVQADIALPIS